MLGELITTKPPRPDRIENHVSALEISMEKIARMDEAEWREALQTFRNEIDAITSIEDLAAFERDTRLFLAMKDDQSIELHAAGRRTIRRLLLTMLSSSAAIGERLVSLPFGTEMFALALTGFVVITSREIHSSFKTQQFRMSESGAARMHELESLVFNVAQRIENIKSRTISDTNN